ncbi:ferritin family protein [Sporomusa acidovorans]|uniref:Rubrerythrin n=1 Tax=Sporomusa acidovorans (strain ATCC 49682 / DSM 3132 / Mol) TaxID=1123286 RepID=A0ABZ3IWY6_SPOA4|nr:ferritin-like domain-containing protein [Sporomusa acidovorans]OZC23592.1 ferritin-like domain protein [Sporomusa acidovorans DSM 3132]SDE21906.1 Rubrerythrin [Sporomusa acidovorans]
MSLFRASKKLSKAKVMAEAQSACLTEDCPNHPDLLLLRDAAADERTAIAFYLEAARSSCMPRLFLDVAEDEMEHYIELMREISRLDPVQAQMLRDEGLDVLLMTRPLFKPKTKAAIAKESEAEDVQVVPPDRKDMPTVALLTRALTDELQAINKYQQYMEDAEDPEVQQLFCHIMNEEKEHIAEFTAALFELTHEPLPEEQD